MALTVDYTAVADYEALHADIDERVKSEALALYSMPLGFGEVTESNAERVYATICVYDMLCGSPLARLRGEEPYHLTPSDVRRRIGLRTNAINGLSMANNLARIAKQRVDEERCNYLKETL